jgi:amino acid transporter
LTNRSDEQTLKRGAVGTIHGVFQSFSFVGPAADVAILLIGTFVYALASTPLAVIIAWLIYGLWMITPYEFSKYKTNAGSYYAYAASSTKSGALGPVTLFSWMGENLTGQSFGILGLAAFLYAISSQVSSIPYIWIVFAVIITAYMFILPYLGIRISLNYVAITGIMEVLVLLVGAIIIIIKVGSANSVVPFTIPSGTLSLVLFGVIFSILDFTGLGTVTTVSEEITEPRKRVRKALIIAWLLSGLALIPASYALTVGWGISNIGSYASSPDPGLIVFQRYLGPVGLILLAVFTINSYFSYGVAKTNAVSRIWFSAARDGVVFPKSLGKVHPKYRTPSNAMVLWLGTSFVLDMVLGFIFGPLTAGLVLLSMAGIAIIFVHVFANTGLSIFSYRELRAKKESNFLYHIVAPTVSSVLGLIVVVYSIQSAVSTYLSAPNASNLSFLVAPVLGVVWCLGIGGALSLYYHAKKKEILMGAGRYDSEQAAA